MTLTISILLLMVGAIRCTSPVAMLNQSCCTEPRCVCLVWENKGYFADCSGICLNKSSFPHFDANVTSIVIANNKIEKIPSPVGKYFPKKLQRLTISGNTIHELENVSFIEMQEIQYIDFSSNKLRNISEKVFSRSYIDSGVTGVYKQHEQLKFLNFSYNRLTKLSENIFSETLYLETLDFSWNFLTDWSVKVAHLKRLKFLNLSSNKLTHFRQQTMNEIDQIFSKSRLLIDLKDNALACTCGTLKFLRWMEKHRKRFYNFETYLCYDDTKKIVSFSNITGHLENLSKICYDFTALISSLSVCCSFLVVIIIMVLVFRYRMKLRYLYYNAKTGRNGYQTLQRELSHAYQFDAFISYAGEDYEVARQFEEVLENQFNLKLFLHQRDFIPATSVAENIARAIETSNKIVFLLTTNFLKSHWCMYEFELARLEGLHYRTCKDLIIFVLLQPIKPSDMSLQMMYMMESNSYIKYPNDEEGKKFFWDKMRDKISIS